MHVDATMATLIIKIHRNYGEKQEANEHANAAKHEGDKPKMATCVVNCHTEIVPFRVPIEWTAWFDIIQCIAKQEVFKHVHLNYVVDV